jgi:Mg2+-importing ATPase
VLGFTTLPVALFAVIALEIVAYLVLIELAKKFFFGEPSGRLPGIRRRGRGHEIARRAARFSAGEALG